MLTRPVRVVIADSTRSAKSFLKLKKHGGAYKANTGKPTVKKVVIAYPDSQDRRLQEGLILLWTRRG